jgi:lysophospholipase L1-like esterase
MRHCCSLSSFLKLLLIYLMVLSMMGRAVRATKLGGAVVLCFGDSWTYGNSHALKEQLATHGHTDVKVATVDLWGSTAEYFANNPHLLPNAVAKHKADFVLLSLGGNDFKNYYWRHKQYVSPWTAVARIKNNMRTVLEALYKEQPDVKVVMYGYDFPGNIEEWLSNRAFEQTTTTQLLVRMYKWLGIPLINYSAMCLGSALESLSQEFKQKGHSLTYIPLWGTLQTAAEAQQRNINSNVNKQKLAALSKLTASSPAEYMTDPIHANQKGFNVLLGRLYKTYFAEELATLQAS